MDYNENEDNDENVNYTSLIYSEDISEKYPITDIDNFYTELYNYYIERGFYPLIIKTLGKLLFKFVSIFCFFIITLCINWNIVFYPSPGREQQKINLFEFDSTKTNKIWLYYSFGTISILIFQLIYEFLYSVKYLWNMKQIRYFYNTVFCIDDNSLTFLKWSDIQYQLVNMKYNEKFPYIRKDITQLSMTQRILRKHNYLTLILNSKYLYKYYISDDMIVYINNLLLNFNKDYTLNKNYLTTKSLYYWLKIHSIINFVLIPFKLLYTIISFLLMNMEVLYTNKDIIGNRNWTDRYFYLYNEYSHLRKYRLNKASYYMNIWIFKNPNTVLDTLLIFIISISSCIISILAPIIVLNAQLSDYIIFGNPLLWYIACFTTIIIISRRYLSKVQDTSTIKYTHEKLKENILFYTCVESPNIPEGNNIQYVGNMILHRNIILFNLVYAQLLQLYNYSIVHFLRNVYSIILNPIILNRLANSHLSLSDFIIKHTYNTIDGDMCIYSDFENINYLVGNEGNELLGKSIKMYINRNKNWYKEYQSELENDGVILPNIKESPGREDRKDEKIKEVKEIKYNKDEDDILLQSDLFISKIIEETSTIINEQDNIV